MKVLHAITFHPNTARNTLMFLSRDFWESLHMSCTQRRSATKYSFSWKGQTLSNQDNYSFIDPWSKHWTWRYWTGSRKELKHSKAVEQLHFTCRCNKVSIQMTSCHRQNEQKPTTRFLNTWHCDFMLHTWESWIFQQIWLSYSLFFLERNMRTHWPNKKFSTWPIKRGQHEPTQHDNTNPLVFNMDPLKTNSQTVVSLQSADDTRSQCTGMKPHAVI